MELSRLLHSLLLVSTPTSVITGDFNRDGKLDLAVANQTDDTVSILLGKGDGTFQTQATYPAGGTSVAAVALGDFDGDNKLDMAVTNPSDGKVSVLLGNGDGTFQRLPFPILQEQMAAILSLSLRPISMGTASSTSL